MHWRHTLLAALVAQLIFSTYTSYIHPDEFYQSFQILHWKDIPWEVQNPQAINRSIVPLLIFYYPIQYIGQSLLGLDNFQTYLFTRIQFALLTTTSVTYFTYRLTASRQDAIKSLLITATNFITLVHQTHTFSNSIESILLLPTLYFIRKRSNYEMLGFLIALGTFNRITFFAWLFLPLVTQLRHFLRHPWQAIRLTVSFSVTALIFVYIDTSYYRTAPTWTVAPLNNILYNANSANLQLHGLHPRVTHILVNIPIILGPMMIPLLSTIYTTLRKAPSTDVSITTLSAISSLLIHSAFPHQELRFLQPAVPLLSIAINPSSLPHRPFIHTLRVYLVYNICASIFFGVLHQGGVVAATNALNTFQVPSSRVLFWRTYPPPTFLIHEKHINIVDLMGAERDVLQASVKQGDLLVASDNAMHDLDFASEALWHTWLHYDMDHWEVERYGRDTFVPGLSVYRIL